MEIMVEQNFDKLEVFLSLCDNLSLWTGHQSIVRALDGSYKEIRLHYDLSLEVDCERLARFKSEIIYTWSGCNYKLVVAITLEQISDGLCNLSIKFENVKNIDVKLENILSAELRILKSLMENKSYNQYESDRTLVNQHHLELYKRVLTVAVNS